ncbi:hypothetical protein EV126DRAFT_49725 [Verticillium dahliae]|nr:hypothetical protein EV126DRAFT_49725 [Verticillium dahliae]
MSVVSWGFFFLRLDCNASHCHPFVATIAAALWGRAKVEPAWMFGTASPAFLNTAGYLEFTHSIQQPPAAHPTKQPPIHRPP